MGEAGSTRAGFAAVVIGGGYMGRGIAQVIAASGAEVFVIEEDAEKASRSRALAVAEAERLEGLGIFDVDEVRAVRAGLDAGTFDDVAKDLQPDLCMEAVPEILSVKAEVLGRASSSWPKAVIASNTSAIPISDLAAHVIGPARFLGIHWMNPANLVPGVEVIPHSGTSPAVVDSVLRWVASWKKEPFRVSDSPGFVANRLQYALFAEASRIVGEELASAEVVDGIVRSCFGFRLPFFGPFEIADIAGLDVYADTFASMSRLGSRFAPDLGPHSLVAAGKLGLKSGEGYYTYVDQSPEDVARKRDERYSALLGLLRSGSGMAD